MWFRKLQGKFMCLLSNLLEFFVSFNLAYRVYRWVFQLGVFKGPKDFKEREKKVNILKEIEYASKISENNKLDVYYPKGLKEKAPVLMWIHGGGYIANSKETVESYMITLASYGFVVFNINYALAPKYKYPSQIIQSNDALKYVYLNADKFMGDKERIFIGGDSAGAQIASELGAIISNEALEKRMKIKASIKNSFLKGIILFCGLYNMETLRSTKFPGIQTYMEALTGKSDFESYENIEELSTIKHITGNYASTFITVGDIDPFFNEGKEFANSLEKLGVKVYRNFYENRGLWHEYQFKFSFKEAYENLDYVVKFLKENSK